MWTADLRTCGLADRRTCNLRTENLRTASADRWVNCGPLIYGPVVFFVLHFLATMTDGQQRRRRRRRQSDDKNDGEDDGERLRRWQKDGKDDGKERQRRWRRRRMTAIWPCRWRHRRRLGQVPLGCRRLAHTFPSRQYDSWWVGVRRHGRHQYDVVVKTVQKLSDQVGAVEQNY